MSGIEVGFGGVWLGQAPYANFHWLEEGPGLVRIGDQGSYALFRVGSG